MCRSDSVDRLEGRRREDPGTSTRKAGPGAICTRLGKQEGTDSEERETWAGWALRGTAREAATAWQWTRPRLAPTRLVSSGAGRKAAATGLAAVAGWEAAAVAARERQLAPQSSSDEIEWPAGRRGAAATGGGGGGRKGARLSVGGAAAAAAVAAAADGRI